MLNNLKGDFDGNLSGMKATWQSVLEDMCLVEVGDSIVTNLDIGDLVPSTSVEGGRWTEEFKKAVIQAVARWHREPEMVQVGKWMARMDADPGAFLKKLSERELKFWKAHVRNNHMPYDRRCSTCVMSTGNGRIHRRIRTPSGLCLSLDICGPFRKRGEDPDHRDYKYALIGAYCLPREKEVSGGKFDERGGDKEVSGSKFDERGGDKEVSGGKFGERGGDKEVFGGKFDEHGGDKEVSGGKFDEHGGDKEVSGGKFDEHGGDKEVSGGKFDERGGDKEVSGGKFDERGGDKEVSGGKFDERGGDKEVFGGNFDERGGDKEVSGGKFDERGGDKEVFHGKFGEHGGDKEVFHGKFGEHGGDKEVCHGKFGEHGGDKEVFHGKFGEHGGDKEVFHGKFGEHGGDKEVFHGKFGEHGGDKEVFHGKFGEHGGDKEVFHGKFGEHGGDKEVFHGKFGEHGGDKEVCHGKFGEHGGDKEVFHGKFGEHGGDKEVSHGNLAKELDLPDMRDLFPESDGEMPVVPERDLPDQPKGMTDEEFHKVFKEVEDGLEYQTLYTMRPLRSRTTREVASAVQDMVLELRAEGLPVVRMHADRARELRTVPLRRCGCWTGAYTARIPKAKLLKAMVAQKPG